MRALVLAAFAVVLLAARPVSAEPIDVGVILPLSGDLALFGAKVRDGILLAAEEHAGKFHLVIEDGEFSNTKTLSAFQKIAATSSPRAVLGPFGPGPTIAVSRPAKLAGTLLIAVALCDERLARLGNVFCLYPGAGDQLRPIIDLFASGHEDIKRIALLLEEVDGIDSAKRSIAEFASRHQAAIVSDKSVATGTSDFRPLLVGAKDADLFIYGGLPANAVLLFRQMKQLGIRPRYRWLWTELDDRIFSENREIFDGAYLPGGLTAFTAEFRERFNKRFGHEPDLYHAIGYDGAASLFETLEGRPELKGAALAAALTELRREHTAVERFHFNADHSVSMPLDVAILENGAPRLLLRE